MREVIGAQGEVTIIKIDALPDNMDTKPVERHGAKGYIISHSEQGHHHCLSGGDVLERTSGVPVGMQILYAVLAAPQRFFQDAAHPHGEYELNPGIYEMRIAREYDPFAEQARRVAD
ncbi:hypothetical protein ACFFTN_01190 [Aminobacter aganoensis]|uniref:Uncharacterized protein n=1 Tax=Aminobacter aganoensis TaxID=83264 RepID=A0A7X0F5W2_9HYPH|nr:hypothetical protein [Aminobacter aganoensis]MBB6353528.1 hypothetical protein [Aminobacter aganoensis]